MNNSQPKITVLVPSYNHGKYIRQRIESICNQTYKNIELCLNNLNHDLFKKHILTDNINLYEVVELIGKDLNLKLNPDHRSLIRKKIDRFITTIKHIRF